MVATNSLRESLRAEISAMKDAELRSAFREGLRLSVEHITRLALILAELEKRGERVQGVHSGLLGLLRAVACGDLLAETIVVFACAPKVLQRVGQLPIEEQERVLADPEECERLLQPRSFAKKEGNSCRASPTRLDRAMLLSMAHTATPKDLAALIAEMIASHGSAVDVWAALAQEKPIQQLLAKGDGHASKEKRA